MVRKSLLAAALLTMLAAAPAFGTVSDATVTAYATQLGAAFPGQVDIYLVGKDFDFQRPSITDAHVLGCSQLAGELYYVIRMSNNSDTFIPQSQILAIHNRK